MYKKVGHFYIWCTGACSAVSASPLMKTRSALLPRWRDVRGWRDVRSGRRVTARSDRGCAAYSRSAPSVARQPSFVRAASVSWPGRRSVSCRNCGRLPRPTGAGRFWSRSAHSEGLLLVVFGGTMRPVSCAWWRLSERCGSVCARVVPISAHQKRPLPLSHSPR